MGKQLRVTHDGGRQLGLCKILQREPMPVRWPLTVKVDV